eukprot:3562118-Rhodomonas_salina.1
MPRTLAPDVLPTNLEGGRRVLFSTPKKKEKVKLGTGKGALQTIRINSSEFGAQTTPPPSRSSEPSAYACGGQGRPGRNRAVDKKGGSARRHGGPPSACSRAIQLPTLTLHKIGCCRVVCTALRRAIWQLSCVRSSPQVRLARLEIKSKKQSLPSFHFGAGMRLLASVFVRLLSIL